MRGRGKEIHLPIDLSLIVSTSAGASDYWKDADDQVESRYGVLDVDLIMSWQGAVNMCQRSRR
jgi:hypothetical protein